jgi:hypothetical protein
LSPSLESVPAFGFDDIEVMLESSFAVVHLHLLA